MQNPLTRSLTTKHVDILASYGLDNAGFPKARCQIFSPGEYISREGESLRHIYFVVKGKSRVLISLSDGKQLLLAHFISAGIIGDIELMTDSGPVTGMATSTLQAVTEFECIALPLAEYRERLKNNIVFINHVGKALAEKLIGRAINGAITTLQPLETRLCAYIYQTASGGVFNETLTEVAAMVGASYRHLLRCLNQLCDRGILSKQAKAYRIVDRKALEQMAGDLYYLG